MVESELREERDRILHRNNAQEILQALATLEERREEYKTRWLWELIQNARDFPDPSRQMTIRISMSDEQITFAHNGRDFTREEILSLIYHGSTKQSNPEQLGKFGTGFLSTHLLSRKVRVKGTLHDDVHGRRAIEFELDRLGDDADEVGDAMQRSFDALEESLSEGGLELTDWTEYVYEADGALDAEELESNFPFDALPYILVFDAKVDKIEIELSERRATYTRAKSEELGTDLRLSVIEGINTVSRFATHEENGMYAAVPVGEQPDGSYEITAPGDVPRFFKFLPLVNTTNIGLPAVFHSRSFSTTENRDGLQFGTSGLQGDFNKRLLVKASNCFLKLAHKCAQAELEGLHRLLDVSAASEPPAWLEDRPRYGEWQRAMIRELSAVQLVELKGGEMAAAAVADFPLGDETMEWEDVYKAGSDLSPERCIEDSIAEECSDIALAWLELLGAGDPLVDSCVFTPERLIERVRENRSLKNLGEHLELERAETVAWLNGLIAAVAEAERAACLDGLVPDQTPEGTFRSNAELSRDTDIDDELKDVLETLSDPIRRRLVHDDIIGAESIIKRVEPREPLVSSARDRLKKQASATPESASFRTACLTMFQWLATEGRWDDLKDAIPVYALDNDEKETVSKTSARGALLAPRVLWPDETRSYWDAFPKGSVLCDDYAPLLDSSSWSEAAANGVLVADLLWTEEEELADLATYTVDLELDGDGHSATSPVEVGKLAFIGTEFYEALRGNRERAARFLQFILDYVVDADGSWKQRVTVECECKDKHEIIPCEWLAFIREREWVPRARGQERLTDASLARLTRNDPRLADTVTREEHTEFLNLVGINVLEQAVLAAGEGQSVELRRRLAQLARLAVQHPGTVTRLIANIEAHHEADQRWRENQKLGKMVEDMIQERLKAQLKARLLFHRVHVKTQFKGYDLGAYVDDPSFADVGAVDVAATGMLLAKIEIKATRGQTVSMSNQQGEEASADRSRFWLCVVPLDSDEDIDDLTADRVETLARFVSDIGSRLAPAREGIQDAVESADESGFDLEHVDEIRYGIRADLWSAAMPLKGFVEALVKQVPGKRQ